MMKFFKRLLPLLLILLLTVPALAVGQVDLSKDGAVTISAPVKDLTFRLYLISTVDSTGELTPVSIFSGYDALLDIRGENDTAWQEAARTLSWFVAQNNLQPTCTGTTDESLRVSFSGLELGLYLVTSDKVTVKQEVYQTTPFFLLLPERSQDGSTWQYFVTVNAKVGPTPLTQDLTVKKVWDDGAAGTKKYPSITVRLWKGSTLHETITLPENGRWWHVWKDLDARYEWTVTEDPVPGYTTKLRWDGSTCTFTIVNSDKPDASSPTNPTDPTDPTDPTKPATPTKPADPSKPTKPTAPSSPATPSKPAELPKTGQLWWPVPVLLCSGAALLLIGLSRRRRSRNET